MSDEQQPAAPAAKATDGEWSFDPNDMNIVCEGTAVLATVMDVHDFPCLDPEEEGALTHEECVANGHMLGAGRVMYEVLLELAPHHPYSMFDGGLSRRLAAALAQAEGWS